MPVYFSITSNTGHPDGSSPTHPLKTFAFFFRHQQRRSPRPEQAALLLFCFAPAKQAACKVEGSLFTLHRVI